MNKCPLAAFVLLSLIFTFTANAQTQQPIERVNSDTTWNFFLGESDGDAPQATGAWGHWRPLVPLRLREPPSPLGVSLMLRQANCHAVHNQQG
jgi:hypothetical protein